MGNQIYDVTVRFGTLILYKDRLFIQFSTKSTAQEESVIVWRFPPLMNMSANTSVKYVQNKNFQNDIYFFDLKFIMW